MGAPRSRRRRRRRSSLLLGRQVGADVLVAVGYGRGQGEEAQDVPRPGGEAVRRPRLVPDDRYVGVADPRLTEDLLLHLSEHTGRERAPARRQQQLDLGYPPFHLDRAHQAHVQDGNALLPAAGIVDPGESVACPGWQLGHTPILCLASPAGQGGARCYGGAVSPQIATNTAVSRDELTDFIRPRHHAIVITARAGGQPQASPVTCGVDAEGRIVVATYPERAKTRNARRNEQVSVLVLSDDFGGPWVQVDGTAEVLDVPEAVEPMVEYFRSISGEHPDWDEYRQAMVRQGKSLLRVTPARWGPVATGGFPPRLAPPG